MSLVLGDSLTVVSIEGHLGLESTVHVFYHDGIHGLARLGLKGDLNLQAALVELVGQNITEGRHGVRQLVYGSRILKQITVMVHGNLNPCATAAGLHGVEGDLCLIGVSHGLQFTGGELVLRTAHRGSKTRDLGGIDLGVEGHEIYGTFPLAGGVDGLQQTRAGAVRTCADLNDVVLLPCHADADGVGSTAGVAGTGLVGIDQLLECIDLGLDVSVVNGHNVNHTQTVIPIILEIGVCILIGGFLGLEGESAGHLVGAVLTQGDVAVTHLMGVDNHVGVQCSVTVTSAAVGRTARQNDVGGRQAEVLVGVGGAQILVIKDILRSGVSRNGLGRITGQQGLAVCLHNALGDHVAVVHDPFLEVGARELIPCAAYAVSGSIDGCAILEVGTEGLVDVLYAAVALQHVTAEAFNHVGVMVTGRALEGDLLLVYGRHADQMLGIGTVTAEGQCRSLEEGAERIDTKLCHLQNTVGIGADVEAGGSHVLEGLHVSGMDTLIINGNVLPSTGHRISVIEQSLHGGVVAVPTVGEAGLQEHVLLLQQVHVHGRLGGSVLLVTCLIKEFIHLGGIQSGQLTNDAVIGVIGTDVSEVTQGDVLIVVHGTNGVDRRLNRVEEEAVLTEANVQLGSRGILVVYSQEGLILGFGLDGKGDGVLLTLHVGSGNADGILGQGQVSVLEGMGHGVTLVHDLAGAEVQDHAVGTAVVTDRHSHGGVCTGEGAIQGMHGQNGTGGEGDDGVTQSAVCIGVLGGNEQDLILCALCKVTGGDGIRTFDEASDADGHAEQTEGVEHADVTVLTVMSTEGRGGDEGLITDLSSGDLDATLYGYVEGQELGDAHLLVVVDADGGEVILVLTLTGHQGGANEQAVDLTHLCVVDGGLDTQVQVGSRVEHGVGGIVGDAGGEIDEGVEDLGLGGVDHVEIHGLVGVEIVIGVERKLTLIEQDQFVVINGHAHTQLRGNSLGSGTRNGLADQLAQLRRSQLHGAAHDANHVGATLGENAVHVVLLAVNHEGIGRAATQHLLNTGCGGVLIVVGQRSCGIVHRNVGANGSRLGTACDLSLGLGVLTLILCRSYVDAGCEVVPHYGAVHEADHALSAFVGDPTGKAGSARGVVQLVVDLAGEQNAVGNTHDEVLAIGMVLTRHLAERLAEHRNAAVGVPLPELDGPGVIVVVDEGGQAVDGQTLQGVTLGKGELLTEGLAAPLVMGVLLTVELTQYDNVVAGQVNLGLGGGVHLGLGSRLGLVTKIHHDAGCVVAKGRHAASIGDEALNGGATDPGHEAGGALTVGLQDVDLVVDLTRDGQVIGNVDDHVVTVGMIVARVLVERSPCSRLSVVAVPLPDLEGPGVDVSLVCTNRVNDDLLQGIGANVELLTKVHTAVGVPVQEVGRSTDTVEASQRNLRRIEHGAVGGGLGLGLTRCFGLGVGIGFGDISGFGVTDIRSGGVCVGVFLRLAGYGGQHDQQRESQNRKEANQMNTFHESFSFLVGIEVMDGRGCGGMRLYRKTQEACHS